MFNNVTRLDPTKNKFAAENLADTLRNWWHSRGHTEVKVWVEANEPISQFGTKLPVNYEIKTNIIQDVSKAHLGMIE
jgi:hypothetical protein